MYIPNLLCRALSRNGRGRSWSLRAACPVGERARILAQAGEVDAALDEIERLLLAGPGFLSVHTLRLEPRCEPLREHPRFQALLAKYEN